MGSFYASCSITNKTISDGDEMVIQFMVPSWMADYRTPTGQAEITKLSMSIFLSSIKIHGFDKAMEDASKTYQSIEQEEEESGLDMAPKGLIVSNEGSLRKWVPVGPAIRGKYDDCGNIAPSEDPENVKRMQILEKIFYGVPFNSVMGAATDDRWLRYGFREGDKHWKVEGLDKNLSKEALTFFKKLSVTYFHASVYDTIKQFDFCAEEGKMKSKYSKEWKKEYLDNVKTKLVPGLEKRIKLKEKSDDFELIMTRWDFERFSFYDQMNRKNQGEYMDRLSLIVKEDNFDWLYESLSFCYGLSGMCMELRQSQYGSQHRNWKGWKRIEDSMNSILEETVRKEKEEWGDDEDENEDEGDVAIPGYNH